MDELLSRLKKLVREESRITLEVIHGLREVEARGLHLQMGFPSLFEFATKYLGYAEGAAYRRIGAMRLIHAHPEVEAEIADGTISLTNAARANTFIRRDKVDPAEAIERVRGKSARAAEESLRELTPGGPHPTERIVLDPEMRELLAEMRTLFSHVDPSMSTSEMIKHMARRLLTSARKSHRHIPAAVRQAVWERDEGRCTYQGTHGRCNSRHLLEFDHIIPRSRGGPTTVENLTLLCDAHNRWKSDSILSA